MIHYDALKHTVHIAEELSHLHHQLRSQPEVPLHPRGPEIQVAILHPQRLRFLPNHKHLLRLRTAPPSLCRCDYK